MPSSARRGDRARAQTSMRSRSARRCAAAPWLGPSPPNDRGAIELLDVDPARDAAVVGSRKASKSALVSRSAPEGGTGTAGQHTVPSSPVNALASSALAPKPLEPWRFVGSVDALRYRP